MRLEFSGELDFLAADYGPKASAVTFSIDYDFTPPKRARVWNDGDPADAPEGAEVIVSRVSLFDKGEPVECPKWLEQIILSAITEDVLIEQAMEDA